MAFDLGSLFAGLGTGLTSYGVEQQKAAELARQEKERTRLHNLEQQKAALEFAMQGVRMIPRSMAETPEGTTRVAAPYFDDMDVLIENAMTPQGKLASRRSVFSGLYPNDPRMTQGVIEGLTQGYFDLNDVLPPPVYDPRRGGTTRVPGGGSPPSPATLQTYVKAISEQYVDAARGMAGDAWRALQADPERYRQFTAAGGTITDFQAAANRPTRYTSTAPKSLAEMMAGLPDTPPPR